MEIKKQVNTYLINMLCSKCEQGFMVVDTKAPAILTNPPKYLHICNYCNNVETYWKKYPTIDYEVINDGSTTDSKK